jgi:hypothetical protein
MARSQRRTALLYDAPLSTREDLALVKAMLLFFDDIAVFASDGHRSRPLAIDPHLSTPLAERGLLLLVNPRAVMTTQTDVVIRSTLHRAATEKADQWFAAAAAGDWDVDVPRLQGRLSRLALTSGEPSAGGEPYGSTNPKSLELFKFLAQDGWLLPDESMDDEWDVTPGMASVANSILALTVRTSAGAPNWLIEPVATRRNEAKVFTAILDDAIENVNASDVVVSDLPAVTPDLSHVGLDDVLDFRARHRNELRAYLVALHALVGLPPASPNVADRRAALVDQAGRLHELQRRRWPAPGATVSLGIVGATWTLGSGDLLGALIGGTAAGHQLLAGGPTPVSAYTYLLRPDSEPAG